MSLKPALRRPNPLAAWRDAHDLTLAQLAEKLGVSVGAVHQIEDEASGNYNRAWLEALAALYKRQPADLISGPPGETDVFLDLWRRLTEPQRQRVVAFAQGMIADQPPPPAPQPPPAAPSNMVRSRLKPQPEIPTIGGRWAPHVYLQEWLDSRHWEPEQLARRIPEADTADIEALLSGEDPYTPDWLWYISKAFRVSIESLYGPPPAVEPKPVKKDGKRAKR